VRKRHTLHQTLIEAPAPILHGAVAINCHHLEIHPYPHAVLIKKSAS
jgi:hypothetical protein